jgi:hypothetical protein
MADTMLSWEAPWSYSSSVTDVNAINGSFWFQLGIFVCAFVLWITIVVKSALTSGANKKNRTTSAYTLNESCKERMLSTKYSWALLPRIIVTRTTASLVVTLALAQIIIFNAIANYSGSGTVNASAALLIFFAGIMFHFYTMSHKFMKYAEIPTAKKHYAISSFLVLLLAIAVFMCFLSYTSAFGAKNEKGHSPLFFAGTLVFALSLFLLLFFIFVFVVVVIILCVSCFMYVC